MATAGATAAASITTSSYRVKVKKQEFLELVEIVKLGIIYQRGRMHFLVFYGFVMYSFQCNDGDFSQKVIKAMEFSNCQWSEWLYLG